MGRLVIAAAVLGTAAAAVGAYAVIGARDVREVAEARVVATPATEAVAAKPVLALESAEYDLPPQPSRHRPAKDAPLPTGPAGGTAAPGKPPDALETEPVMLAQAGGDSGKSSRETDDDSLRQQDSAIEEDESKIPVDAEHKGYSPLSFKTLANYKYEVFIPEDGSRPEDLPPEAFKDQIPDSIKKLDKKKIAIRGFMVPTIVEVEGVRGFLLTRSRSLCCFGEMPEMNEWIEAELPEGKFTDFYSDVVITVYGTIDVGEQRDGGVVLSLYRMDVDEVVPMPGEDVESYYM